MPNAAPGRTSPTVAPNINHATQALICACLIREIVLRLLGWDGSAMAGTMTAPVTLTMEPAMAMAAGMAVVIVETIAATMATVMVVW